MSAAACESARMHTPRRADFLRDRWVYQDLREAKAYQCAWRIAREEHASKGLLTRLRAMMRFYAVQAYQGARQEAAR